MHFGLQLWPQNTGWASLKEHGLLADELGYDSLWTWDHFAPIAGGDVYGAQLECWQVLAAWGALTKRVRIGALVTGNTYRHPAVLAKQAVALDHITGGRAILGMGAGWMEFEHKAYGIPFGTAGERLTKLSEAVRIVRSLLDEPRTTFKGTHYQLTDAPAEPKPIQKRLPILIGGGGEKRTLRITARYADLWHGFGTPEEFGHKVEVLRAHCADVGRDPAAVMPLAGGSIIVTDDASRVEARMKAIADLNRVPPGRQQAAFHGNPDQVAARLAAFWKAGARGYILGMPSPHDREIITRFATEVIPRVKRLVA